MNQHGEQNMSEPNKPLALALLCVLAGVTACSKQETAAETNADVAKAQQDKSEDVSEAVKDRAEVVADTAADAASRDPDDRGDAMEDRAEAAYNVAMAKADGDRKIAKQACDAMPAASQSSCNMHVH
jgi:cytochrome P450